jgi:hypothetical protein
VNVAVAGADRYQQQGDADRRGVVRQVAIAKNFKAELAELPGPIASIDLNRPLLVARTS